MHAPLGSCFWQKEKNGKFHQFLCKIAYIGAFLGKKSGFLGQLFWQNVLTMSNYRVII
jgi:hypothetical protein